MFVFLFIFSFGLITSYAQGSLRAQESLLVEERKRVIVPKWTLLGHMKTNTLLTVSSLQMVYILSSTFLNGFLVCFLNLLVVKKNTQQEHLLFSVIEDRNCFKVFPSIKCRD